MVSNLKTRIAEAEKQREAANAEAKNTEAALEQARIACQESEMKTKSLHQAAQTIDETVVTLGNIVKMLTSEVHHTEKVLKPKATELKRLLRR